MIAFLLELDESGSGDGLDFGYDVVRLLQLDDFAQFVAVEHIEYVGAVCHLHGRGVGIFVAGHYLHAQALEFDCYFFAELSAAEQKSLATHRGHDRSYFCHCR